MMPQREKPKKYNNVGRQKLLASIDIFTDSMVATIRGDGGVVKRGFVGAAELVDMLGGLGAKDARWIRCEMNVVAIGTASGGDLRFLVVRPAKRTMITCEIGRAKKKLSIAMPALLGELAADHTPSGVRFKAVKAVYAFAGHATALRPSTQLYAAPVPNAYADGHLCMGDVQVKRFADLAAAECFEKAFIESLFTDHHGGVLVGTAEKKYRGIIDYLVKTKGRIRLDDLRKVKTYGQICKK